MPQFHYIDLVQSWTSVWGAVHWQQDPWGAWQRALLVDCCGSQPELCRADKENSQVTLQAHAWRENTYPPPHPSNTRMPPVSHWSVRDPTAIYLYHAAAMPLPKICKAVWTWYGIHYSKSITIWSGLLQHTGTLMKISCKWILNMGAHWAAHCEWSSAGALRLWVFVPPLLGCFRLRLHWLFQTVFDLIKYQIHISKSYEFGCIYYY